MNSSSKFSYRFPSIYPRSPQLLLEYLRITVFIFILLPITWCLPASFASAADVAVEKPLPPTVFIVSVGINKYKEKIPSPTYAAIDAKAISTAFETGASSYAQNVVNHTLLDEEATRTNIEEAIKQVILAARPDDVFIFYYSGAATNSWIPWMQLFSIGEFNLYPSDAPRMTFTHSAEKSEGNLLISGSLFHSWISQIRAKNQLIIIDGGSSDMLVSVLRDKANQEFIWTRHLADKNLVLLGSADIARQNAELGHGLLTYTILQGLQGAAVSVNQGVITARGLEAYLYGELLRLSGGRQHAVSWAATNRDFTVATYGTRGFIIGTNEVTKPTVTPPPKANNYALLFATDRYDEWGELRNPIADAKAIGEELENNYGFQVEKLFDAVSDDVYGTLKRYLDKEFGPDDQLFIFFAGHGNFDEQTGRGFVVARDSKAANTDPFGRSQLPQSILRDIIDRIPVKHIFLAMDVCFGGSFDPRLSESFHRANSDDPPGIAVKDFIGLKRKLKTRMFLTSGSKEYVPDGRPGGNSPFARRMLEALRSYGGKDRVLTLARLHPYFERLQTEPRMGEFGANQPGSEFFFINDPALR